VADVSRATNWFGLSLDTFQLALEAQTVIGLRLAKIAQGDAAAWTEANLMFAEKAQAVTELQTGVFLAAVAGAPRVTPRKAVAHLRKKVRANRRRLSR
jgi:hypothetical protein